MIAEGPWVIPVALAQSLMPTEHIITLLIAERDKLNRALETLQGQARKRGGPPNNPPTQAAPAECYAEA
jgi:hypothetical protein